MELIKTDERILQNEAQYRALVTAISHVVYRMSPDWTQMCELQGRGFLEDTWEPISDWLTKYIHPKDQQYVLSKIREAIDAKSIFELEHQVLRADGTLGWTFSRAVPILDKQGNIIEWFGAANDITRKKEMEDALRQSQQKSEAGKRVYEAIMSNTPDLIYVFNLEYRFTYANNALLKMWGLSWEQAIGKTLLEIGYEPWHAAMHEREIDHVIATQQSIRGEVSFPHAVLGKRIYDYIFVPVINEEGKVEAVAGTTRDITEIREAEAALRRSREELEGLVADRTKALQRSNDDLQQFAHVASHDLQEPLRKIQMFTGLLRMECEQMLPGKAAAYLDKITHAVRRMSEMVSGILSYASLEVEAEGASQVNLNDLLRDIETDLEITIRQKQAVIEYRELPVVEGYRLLLSQLFSNLISNSLKFCKPGGLPCIQIREESTPKERLKMLGLDEQGSYTTIVFQDNGIGFSPEYSENIFQAFSRLHSKAQFDGTGLGLALCRKIAERHGGAIYADGRENEGATFTIILAQPNKALA